MYCPGCGKPRADLGVRCPECGAAPFKRGSSGWAWFFAGSTLALALMLGGLIWGLSATGAIRTLMANQGGAGREAAAAVARIPMPATPAPPANTPSAGSATPAPRATPIANDGSTARAQVGELVSSGTWKLVVGGSRSEPQTDGLRVFVDLTVKNDGERAATLEIPSTVPRSPRSRPASFEDVQMAGPPPLELTLLDRANRTFGGSFVGADGQPSGSYTFLSAPGDAIRLTYAFDVPSSSAEPFVLDARFGGSAGGARVRVQLDDKAGHPATLAPSDVGKVAAKDERFDVGDLWALTVTAVEVGEPSGSGERTVTVRMKAENPSDETGMVAAPRGDISGRERDFYLVDAAGQMAFSGADTMPTTRIPARASRNVDVKLKAPKDFATSGPYRFSVIVDATRNRYAVFKLG
jgi:hypothetical protein